MEKIGIIGSGTWGTAIAVLLRNNGHEVTLWSAIPAEIEKMAKNYGMEADKLKEYMGEGEKESMKRELAITKAVELIMDNIKERAKAKTKKEKEAEAEAEA